MIFYLSDLLLFPAIFQGILISFILLTKRKGKHQVNNILSVLMISSALMLIGRMIYDRFPEQWMVQIAFVPDVVIYIFGPLTYLFLAKLLSQRKLKFTVVHFIPAGIYAMMVTYFFTLGSDYFDHLITTPAIWELIFYIETSGIISNVTYSILSMRLLFQYTNRQKEVLSFDQPVIGFIRVYMTTILLCQLLWIGSYVGVYWMKSSSGLINYTTVWYSMPFISYVIGYYMLVKPPIFLWSYSKKKDENGRLYPDVASQMKSKLDTIIDNDRIYLKQDLTLKELAELINTSVHNLSSLLNDVYKQCFYDFINELRIKEFVEKVSNGEHVNKTILGLALEVGFKSKSTFNKAFKVLHNKTPSEFINEVDSSRMRHSA